jgi:hypothetical protein
MEENNYSIIQTENDSRRKLINRKNTTIMKMKREFIKDCEKEG